MMKKTDPASKAKRRNQRSAEQKSADNKSSDNKSSDNKSTDQESRGSPTEQKTAKARNRYDEDEYLDEKVSLFNIKRCIKYIAGVQKNLGLALGLSIIGNLVGLTGPLFIQHALDVAVPNKDYRLLFTMAAFLAGAIIISIAMGAIRNVLVARAGADIIHDIRSDLFIHLQKLPFTFYDSRPHGKIFVRVVPYVNSVSDALSNGIINFIIEVLNIFFIVFFMFREIGRASCRERV